MMLFEQRPLALALSAKFKIQPLQGDKLSLILRSMTLLLKTSHRLAQAK
jgi:hypothetical protein